MEKKDERGREDILDLRGLHGEFKEDLSKPQDTILTFNDPLDNIISNLEKVSLGHFGSVCE